MRHVETAAFWAAMGLLSLCLVASVVSLVGSLTR